MLVDSHAHLTSDELNPHLEAILERAQAASVCKVVNICTDLVTLQRGLDLQKNYPWVYNAAATTPHDVDQWGEVHFATMSQSAKLGQLVAVGETGLDYHYQHSQKSTQQHFLKKYAQLATECHLPLIIHCRDAFADLFSILDAHYKGPCLLHCFTGTLEEAKAVIARGWFLSLSGIVTFKKSETLRHVAEWLPLDKLFIETDAPYLAPQKHRGTQNEPAFISETAQFIADLKGIPLQTLAEATRLNCETFFKI